MSNEGQQDFIPSQEEEEHKSSLRLSIRRLSNIQLAIFILAGAYTLYFVKPVLLPLILALLITLALKPIHKFLHETLHIISPVSAILILIMTTTGVGTAIYYLSEPAIEYSEKLRDEIVKERLKNVFQPITDIQSGISKVADEVEKITAPGEPEKVAENSPPASIARPEFQKEAEPHLSPVEVPAPPKKEEPRVHVEVGKSTLDQIYNSAKAVGYHLVITFVLVFFLLAYGETMIKRITEVEATAALMDQLTIEVSRYMLTITLINTALGIITGLAMWALGMPNPILWGVMAGTLNFIPYIGAIIGSIIVFLVGATHFDNHLNVIMVPAVYYILTAIEGNFVTPAILGKSFTVNPIVIFVWVFCWGALWGIPGMLIGLPLLMVCRITLSKFPAFKRIERIISVR